MTDFQFCVIAVQLMGITFLLAALLDELRKKK